MTPKDSMAFVGDPPMIRTDADEVHISVCFTWDILKADRLAKAWGQYYPVVRVGGPAFGSDCNGFVPGFYVRQGVTFTSRGCNNSCPWCLVPEREGKLRPIGDFSIGNIIQDNNLLQCDREHIDRVFAMLRTRHAIEFTGGLDSRLITDPVADGLRSLRVRQLFLSCDTKEALKPLRRAASKLSGFNRNHLRCYVLIAYGGETISEAVDRLRDVWVAGFVPFAQLYQPKDRYIEYSKEWKDLARTWSRPAAMKARAPESKGNRASQGRRATEGKGEPELTGNRC